MTTTLLTVVGVGLGAFLLGGLLATAVQEVGPEMREDKEPGQKVTDWALSHTPLLATVGLFVLTVIRIVRVASFDPATAAALVRETGVASVVMGTLVGFLPFLLWAAAVALTFFAQSDRGSSSQREGARAAIIVIFGLLMILLPSLHLLVYFLVWVVLRLRRKLGWFGWLLAPTSTSLVVVIWLLLDVPTMWLLRRT